MESKKNVFGTDWLLVKYKGLGQMVMLLTRKVPNLDNEQEYKHI